MPKEKVLCCECDRVKDDTIDAIKCCNSNKVIDIIVPDFCPRCFNEMRDMEFLRYNGDGRVTGCDECEERLQREDKLLVVHNLEKLLRDIPGQCVKSLKLEKEYGREEVIVTFNGGGTIAVNVACNSELAICRDVLKNL